MNLPYSIRQAFEDDLEGSKRLLDLNGQKPTLRINDRSLYYLAEEEGVGIIGLAGAEISGDAALIRSTAVLAPYRGKGIARKLVMVLSQALEERGIRRLYLFSRDTGAFWERFGFSRCEVRDVIGDVPDAHQVVTYIADNSIWTDVAWRRSIPG